MKHGSNEYVRLHSWVKRHLGKPSKCEHCGTTTIREGRKLGFVWANKSGEYKWDLEDWERLCYSCHQKKDGYGYKKGDPSLVKEYCIRGHALTGSNIFIRPRKAERGCRACRTIHMQNYHIRRKAKS